MNNINYKLCFISNFHKTFLFHDLAQGLKKYDYDIFWICFSQKMYDFLLNHYKQKKILLLDTSFSNKNNLEISDFKINELVYADRSLKHQKKIAFNYLKNIQKPFYEFIKLNQVKFIFGETTYAHEILMNRIINFKKELKSYYLHPQSVRIPDGRFFFLENEFQNTIFKSNQIINSNWKDEFETIIVKPPKRVKDVDREVIYSSSTKGRLTRIKRFFTKENIEKKHPSLIQSRRKRSIIALKEEFNKFSYNFIKKDSFDSINNKECVLYTLHMQPEASVDVVGAYYDDQFLNIKNISKILPLDWFLIVKEHSNAIGNRNYSFYRKIKKLNNIILIDEKVSSHKLIDHCKIIFTVSGTIAYEAALKGKIAFTFADIFFNKLKGCSKISIEDFRRIENINGLIQLSKNNDNSKLDINDFSKFLFMNSYKGIVDAPLNSKDWLCKENTLTLIQSFRIFIKSMENNV